jgi:hypothetical protein
MMGLQMVHRSKSSTVRGVVVALACTAIVLVGACATPAPSSGVGAQHAQRFALPADKAAACFARNAEEHSSALVSEVRTRANGGRQVIVRVKNGVLYANAEIEPAGSGSRATITLMVVSRSGQGDLLASLTEGC